MHDRLAETLESTLAKALALDPDPEDAAPLQFGDFRLVENSTLLMALASTTAKTTGAFPDFHAFQKLFQSRPDKPIAPERDAPEYQPRPAQSFPPEIVQAAVAKVTARNPELTPREAYTRALDLLAKVDAQNRFDAALTHYHERHRHYQEIQARSRAITQAYNPQPERYLDFVRDTVSARDPGFADTFFFASRPLPISEDSRRAHTFLSGATKSGKSETLKYLIRHYLTKNTRPALVVLDPHGKLAMEVAQMREFAKNDRLVLVAPSAFPEANIALNPFDCRDKSETGLNTQSRQLMAALERVLGSWTDNAKGMMPHCIALLLHREGSTLYDLLTLMDDEANDELVRYGATRLPFDGSRRFFEEQFKTSRHYDSTKEMVRNRLQQLLSSPVITRFLCRESTVDFEAAIDAGKVIILNCTRAKMDQQEVGQIGQFIMARIQGYCLTRELIPGNPMTPVHVFADECQYFVNETVKEILGENRKHGLHITLATQRTDQMAEDAGQKLVDAVIGNVGVFITGRGGGKTPEKIAPEIGMKTDDIRDLKPLNFFYTEKAVAIRRPSIQTQIPYIGTRYSMTPDDWGLVLSQQIERYYRPLSAPENAGQGQDDNNTPQSTRTPRKPAHAPKFAFQDLAKMRQPGTLKK